MRNAKSERLPESESRFFVCFFTEKIEERQLASLPHTRHEATERHRNLHADRHNKSETETESEARQLRGFGFHSAAVGAFNIESETIVGVFQDGAGAI